MSKLANLLSAVKVLLESVEAMDIPGSSYTRDQLLDSIASAIRADNPGDNHQYDVSKNLAITADIFNRSVK